MASTHSALPRLQRYFRPISVFLIQILFLTEVDSLNQGSDATALLRFKDDNIHQVWGVGPGWANWKETDENPCAWFGVTCTNKYTVSELDLSGWGNYKGTDLGWIYVYFLGYLPDLRELRLSSNRLLAVEGINYLQGLTRLDLSFNHLSADSKLHSLAGDICSLKNLTWLDLSFNNISGPIPPCLFGAQSLRYVSFQQNNFSGEVPTLYALQKLQFLCLADNQLSGPFPKALDGLNNIVIVDLSNNSLSGTIPAFPNATNLVQLKLDNNKFTGFDDPWLVGASSSLSTLSVSYNQLTASIPSGILDMANLQFLNMSSNQLTGRVPKGLGSLPLRSLDLSQNLLVENIPSDLLGNRAFNVSYSEGCASLNLSYNRLDGIIPDVAVDERPCFEILDLSYNNLSGPVPSSLFNNYSSISTMWLQNNRLNGDVIDLLLSNEFIEFSQILLQNNLFTGDLTRFVNSSTFLFVPYIDLRNNGLRWSTSDAIPDPISATLETWATSHFYLGLGGNNFSGTPVPTACPRSLLQLQVLDLSNSHLQGEIWGSAFNSSCFPSLLFLDLSWNDISGSVPEDIFMSHLQMLNLSHNNLSGSLPQIPPNSIFNDPHIFSGNDGLCGYPLPQACSQTNIQSNPPPIIPFPNVSGATGVGLHEWQLFLIIGGALIIATGSCLAAIWRWRVYQKRHQQDADLIDTLLERDSATLMSLRELRKATDNFAKSSQIGEGGFGTVYAGKLNDGTMVAIKRSKREGSDKDKQQFLNEVRILSQVSHRNLVKLLGCCMENKTAVLVFEFVSNGTLQDHLHGKFGADPLSWPQRLKIAVETANALTYLHTATASPIYHRDVKSANILLDEQFNAKVADFGISKLAPLQATHVSTVAIQGTMGYIDPEYYTSYRLTDKSDVFSFGVVLLELISSKLALDLSRKGDDSSLVNLASCYIIAGDLEDLIDPVLSKTYHDPAGQGRESILQVGRLAMKCVSMRSRSRPSMSEVCKELEMLFAELTGTGTLGTTEAISENDEEVHNQELWNLWIEMSGIKKDDGY